MRKFKFFSCHKFGHYVGQCPNRKKGGNETQPEVVASEKTQMDEIFKKFEHTKFLLVSQTSLETISTCAWLINSGSTCHMTGAQELFKNLTDSDLEIHMELNMGTKHAVKGCGIMSFRMDSICVVRFTDVLWVPELKMSVFSVSVIDKRGFDGAIQNGKALINSRGSISYTTIVIGVRESNLYRLNG
jgi:hypothetical protein